MKSIFLVLMFSCTSLIIHAQSTKTTLSDKEAKKIANDINTTIDNIGVSLDNIDWKAVGDLLSTTIETANQHADALNKIAKNIDMEKVNAAMEKIAANIEVSIDAEKLEKQLNQLGQTLQQSIQPTAPANSPEIK